MSDQSLASVVLPEPELNICLWYAALCHNISLSFIILLSNRAAESSFRITLNRQCKLKLLSVYILYSKCSLTVKSVTCNQQVKKEFNSTLQVSNLLAVIYGIHVSI